MIEGFLLGISNTLSCMGVCAPILIPFMLTQTRKPIIPIANFLIGRFLAYMFFAFFGGMVSIYFEGRIDPYIFSVLTIVMAIWLILYALGRLNLNFSLCRVMRNRVSERSFPLFTGFVMGINICPPLLLSLSEVLQMGSVIKSLVFFFGFFLGSSVWTLPLLFAPKLSRNPMVIKLGQGASIIIGLWFLWKGIKSLIYFLF